MNNSSVQSGGGASENISSSKAPSSTWNIKPKTEEARRSVERLRNLEKTMVVRIFCLLTVAVLHAILVVAFMTQYKYVAFVYYSGALYLSS